MLLTSTQTLTTTNNQTFVLGNLTGLTSGNGIYSLAVNTGGAASATRPATCWQRA